ncbi:MAG: DUF6351 family protein [Actinomycetota bacterium]
MTHRSTSVFAAVAMIATLIPAVAVAAPDHSGRERGLDRSAGFDIEVVSSPPEFVSGGDARLVVEVPPGQVDKVTITVEGRDVTDSFSPIGPRVLEGVVDGLDLGDNLVEVRPRNSRGRVLAEVTLTNHPITGPIFSGPQQEPFLCSTPEDFGKAELATPIDDDCTMERIVSFKYRSTSGEFKDFDPEGDRPADMAQTTTLDGETVDFVVRWERGTINRFIYSIAMLSPGSQEVDEPDLSAWNDRLIYHFQGGVGIGRYQGDPSGSRMFYDYGLSNGYAVAYSTGTKTGEHYNLVLGGETAIMVKDRFVSAYGNPDYTVGIGASGGAIQQYVYGQNHKGLIDAAIPVYSYPDMITQTIHVGDCELLERWMDTKVLSGNAKWANWENRTLLEGMNAINGFDNTYSAVLPFLPPGSSECVEGWRGLSALALNPHFGTAPGVTPEQQANTEWTHYGDAVNVYGVNPDDGFANSTWDNVGVQYGLEALVNGEITKEEFLDLNTNVGSWKNEPEMIQEGCPFIGELCPSEGDLDGLDPVQDIYPELIDPWSWRNMALSPDGTTPAPRKTADPNAIENAYEKGHVFVGDMEIPIIDWRNYLERELDMHNSHQSFAARQRLLDHDGDAGNQVIWFTDGNDDGGEFDQTPLAFDVIDEWMANIEANPALSVEENRPERAVDSCFDAEGNLIYSGEDAWDGILGGDTDGPCTEEFHVFSTSRIVAGGPISGDVFKCALQPVEEAIAAGVYGSVEFEAEELARLKEIFPTGVCDYSQGDARRP